MDEIKKKLGKKIQELRKARKLTQEKLAELIGIETTNFSKIETGRNYPTSENLKKIATVLEVQPVELFSFNDLNDAQMLEEIHKRINLVKDDRKKLEKIFLVIKALT